MDINFHYFAVKTIAIEAGFGEPEAQLIAEYSQFVDDYTVWENYAFREIPDYAQSLTSWSVLPGYKNFYTVTTGFDNWADMARLVLGKYQREIVVPFHFIPYKKLKDLSGNREEYRTSPADITGDSLVANLLRDAKNKCMDPARASEHRYDLMRVGVLLHVFADTYAHDGFSGFHGWENFCYITKLKRTDSEEDFKDEETPDYYNKIYALGHAEAGHAPDMTYAYFEYKYAADSGEKKKDEYTKEKSRNNTNTFLGVAKQIYTLLYQICNNNELPDEEKLENLKEKLLPGFRTEGVDFKTLEKAWKKATSNRIEYTYSAKKLWQDQLIDPILMEENAITEEALRKLDEDETIQNILGYYRTADDDFFHFNLIAKEIRDAVIK